MKTSSQAPKGMVGFQLTFFTQQDHRYQGKSLAQWLLEEARSMGIGGATLIAASEGFGHHRHLHQMHLINFPDQPLEVVMAVTAEEADRIFARLTAEKIKVFYSKTPVEFGTIGGEE
jgi:PII-like signaling protein